MVDRSVEDRAHTLDPCLSMKTLDEAVWRTWEHRSRVQEMHAAATRITAVKYVCIGTLLLTAALWAYAGPYHLLVRALISAGALRVACRAISEWHYVFATVFFAMVLLYNPILPLFPLSGSWQLLLVLGSIIPFAASLIRTAPIQIENVYLMPAGRT